MRTIHKYQLWGYSGCVGTHAGAHILSCGMQHDIPVVWLRVDTIQPARDLYFWCVNTGDSLDDLPDGATFLGTVTASTGIVWHVFFAWKAP